jgi:hypothetical protein
LDRFQIFLLGDAAIDLREFMGSVFRPILVHDVDIRMNRDLFSDEPENGFRRSHSMGHHQVSDQESPLGNPFGIGGQVSDLAVHLFKNSFEDLRIVRSIREFL